VKLRLEFYLALAVSVTAACNWRKPLPRNPDAGPPVELVDARPSTGRSASSPSSAAAPALPLLDEHEPNDDVEHAQPIVLAQGTGRGVRGSLLPPTTLGAGKGADDWYAISVGTATGPQLLRIELLGGPQADLSLDLFDGNAPRATQRPSAMPPPPFAHIDERGRGETERATLGVRSQEVLLLRVRGSVQTGAAGQEASDYQLRVTQAQAPAGSEVEPNDTPELATLATTTDLSGTLPWRGDEDFWVVNLSEALYRRPGSAGTAPAAAAGKPPGLQADAILRIELRTPGATPALRVLLEPADSSPPDGGESATSFRKLKFLLDLAAAKGGQELRLRNVGLPAGSARALIGVRALSLAGASGRGAADARYQLRLVVEPALEDAESEPNDDCGRANLLTLTPQAGSAAEGFVAGFLWPGDTDCFRIRGAAAPQRHSIQLSLPGAGSDCRAVLDWVRSEGIEQLPGADGGTSALLLHGRGDALIRVLGRDSKTCFDVPYRLVVRSDLERP